MTQGILSFKYENDKQKIDMTGFGGLPVSLQLAEAAEESSMFWLADRYP